MRLYPVNPPIIPFPLFADGRNAPRSVLELMPDDPVFRANWEWRFAQHREEAAELLEHLKRIAGVPSVFTDQDGLRDSDFAMSVGTRERREARRAIRPELIRGGAEPFAYYGPPPRAGLRSVR